MRKFKLAKAFTAFNSNVDCMVLGVEQVSKALHSLTKAEIELVRKKSAHEPKELKDKIDFFGAFLHSLGTGKAVHVAASDNVCFWLENTFEPGEKRIGGQAGIMANQLAAFGDLVLTYSSLLSPYQAGFFDKTVCFPVFKGKKLVCMPSGKAAHKEHGTKVNWIFEFKFGEKIHFAGHDFAAPRSNRMIVSSFLHYIPIFPEDLNLAQVGKTVDVAFLSGFQQLRDDKSFNKNLSAIQNQLKKLKSLNKKLFVHWEFVPLDDKGAGKKILQNISKSVDGMGLNEVELVEALTLLDHDKEADAIKKKENSYTLYKGAVKLLKSLKLKRVHVHSFGFQILVLDNPYPINTEKCRDALIFSSILASLKALKGSEFVTRKEFEAHSIKPSQIGFNQLRALEGGIDEERIKRHSSFNRKALLESGIFELKDHFAIIVPAPIVQSKSTVGLGDVISSMALACERS